MGGLGLIFILLMFGLGGALVAHVKGNSVALWFLISFLVPFAGLAAAILARAEIEEPRRQCERCGRLLPVSATVCAKCGIDLEFPETILPSVRDERAATRS